MTQHVRKGYRNHRKLTWVAALAVASAAALAALALVLPALGASADTTIPPPSGDGVYPTLVNVGGSNFDCTTNAGGVPAGLQSFTVSSPPNSTTPVTYSSTNTGSSSTPLPAGVTLTLTGYNGTKKGKFFNFAMAGATVFHVGVKGGTDSAWYNYIPNGGVASDTLLHATLKDPTDPTSLYNASYTTFCYTLTTTISGKVFLDNNADGSYNTSSSPPDVGQDGWTVKLFNTSASPAVQMGSVITPSPSSAAAGSYTFTGVPIGSNYKVCVQKPSGDSGTYDQTFPTGTTQTSCSDVSGALSLGQAITNLQSPGATGQDFGVEQTVSPGDCTSTFSPSSTPSGSKIVEYTAQMTIPPGQSGCKDAVVMYSYLAGSTPYAIIHPTTANAGTTKYWVVERIRMMVTTDAQNPIGDGFKYDDYAPYGDTYTLMRMCTADPRSPGQDFQLAEDPAGVMPSGTTAYGQPESSCMIQSTRYHNDGVTDSGVTYNYEAYIATDVDGIKTPS